MKLLLIAVGKMKSREMAALAADYGARLGHYLPFETKAVRDDAAALKHLEANDHLIVLDERGRECTSEELAQTIAEHQARGIKRIICFIGGPDGVSDAMRTRANDMLALSRMTLPHELAQVLLLEQLYRACSILRNEPYHRSG